VTVAIYVRISSDRDDDERGVKRQTKLCRELVAARGWDHVLFEDNDVSARGYGKRPDYRRLLEAVRAGDVDRVVVYHTSRLWRNRRERAEGIEALQAARVSVVAVRGPELDMTTAYGRGMAGMVGEFDTMESEVRAERVKAAADERAERGRWHGGTLAFGLRRDGDRIVHHPVNAQLLRDAARRVLAGESLYAICRDWTRRGVRTQRGGQWRSSVLRSALLTPSVVGLRVHEGREYPVPWKPIIERQTWDRLRPLLLDPARSFQQPIAGGWEGKRPLNGLARCAVCGGKLVAQRDRNSPRFTCRGLQDGCSSIRYRALERFVLDMVLARLDGPEFRSALARRETSTTDQERVLEDELAALELRRRRIGEAVEVGAYTRDEAAAKVREVKKAERGVRDRQAALARTHVLDGVESAADARELWDAADVTRRRRFLASFITEVVVSPFPAGRCRTPPRRRGETDADLAARREEHERETLRLRVDVRWRR